MTLTGCIVHGVGVFLFLCDEGMPTGAGWSIEVESQQQYWYNNFLPFSFPSRILSAMLNLQHRPSQAMRSLDRAYAIAQAKNRSLPAEFLG